MWPSYQKKNINLYCESFIGKVFSENWYHQRTFIAFKTCNQCSGHIQDIVCRNVPKLGTCVHCRMPSNVAEQRFWHVSQQNPLFIFPVHTIAFFVKRLPRVSSKMAPKYYLHKVDNISCTITKMHAFWSFVPISDHLNDFLPMQLETSRFWTTTATLLGRYFSKISFLGSKVSISS